MNFVSTFIAVISLIGIGIVESSLQVRTTSGILTGHYNTDWHIREFLGVPFGVPPVGDLRFKAPVPLYSSERTLKVQKFAATCVQPPHIKSAINPLLHFNQTSMSEDCLYLNLYAPPVGEEELFPVMVFLAGEGFNYADPSQFDGTYLASTSKVIVVTISYRVSVFGFLNTLSKDAPGNVGLLDQRLALKWIQNNIKAFGGDANKVTLCGRFTGAMSAAIHAFSPVSRNETLFQRIILHSGVPDGKWVIDTSPLNAVTEVAEIAGCVYNNISATISCLKNLTTEEILKHSLAVKSVWRPSLDFNLIDETSITSKITKGNYSPVDVLIFTNNNEGSICLTALKVFNITLYDKMMNGLMTKAEKDDLMASFLLDVYKDSNSFVNKLVSFVYGENPTTDMKTQFMKFCGDLYISAASQKLADVLADKNEKVFVAELVHRPSFSNQPKFIEAGHGDSVVYSLGLPLQLQNLPEREKHLTREIMRRMESFMHYGNPSPKNEAFWPMYSNKTRLVKLFGAESVVDVVKTTHEETALFWQNIIPAAYQDNCPPMPFSAALIDPEENNAEQSQVSFLGTLVSVPAAEHILNGLLYFSGMLVISLLLCLSIILRQSTSTSFRRLK